MPPRMVTARLWAPIPPGPLTSKVDVLHAGKSVRILRSSLSVPAKTVGEVDVVFGAPRASAIVIPAPEYPEGAVESAFPLPASGPHLPAFLQHMEVRWLEGQPPFTGGSTPVIGGFCRHRDGEGGLSEMIGLLDCWPSPALSLSKRPIAASTVQWTIHFTQPDPVHSDWYRFLSTALTSNEGYVSMRGDLWGDSGQHIAWMEQLVAVYG